MNMIVRPRTQSKRKLDDMAVHFEESGCNLPMTMMLLLGDLHSEIPIMIRAVIDLKRCCLRGVLQRCILTVPFQNDPALIASISGLQIPSPHQSVPIPACSMFHRIMTHFHSERLPEIDHEPCSLPAECGTIMITLTPSSPHQSVPIP